MGFISFDKVELLDGFWKQRYELNANVSIPSILSRFKDSRVKAVLFGFKKEELNVHHVAYDSDVAKLIEAMAYLLRKEREKYPQYEKFCDEMIDSIASHQLENGYYNSYFLVKNPDEAFTKREAHELYNLGHLIEAGIAYFEATGKDKLLKVCDKYLDYVERRIIIDKDTPFITPGHEEIELALMRLYNLTKKNKYFRLAEFFLENRGNNQIDKADFYGSRKYIQENEPIRKLTSVEGHAVRAVYLFDGMAKYNLVKKDIDILKALRILYKDLCTKQYISGGIGSCKAGEILTIPYDVPNLTAYNESCAAIGEMFFLNDLFALEQDKEYHDNFERILYNGFLSSTSISGKAFFYENPLEIRHKDIGKETSIRPDWRLGLPITQRVELFECSCCPPNIARFIASIGNYIYFEKENKIYINQFISSKVSLDNIEIQMNSGYPKDFNIELSINSKIDTEILLRVPEYADKVILNGKEIKDVEDYLRLNIRKALNVYKVQFVTSLRLMEANPNNPFDQNRVALMYGPILYCIEGVDNGDELNSLFVDSNIKVLSTNFEIQYGMNTFSLEGFRKLPSNKVYSPSFEYTEQQLIFIPYCRFANRGETDMLVWVNKK